MVEDEAAAVIGFRGMTEREQTLDFEALLLPLRHYGETKSRLLGAASPADMPYWIGIWPIHQLSISSMRLIWPDERPAFMREPAANNSKVSLTPVTSSLQPSVSSPAISPDRRIGHLTVIQGGLQD